MPFYFFGASSLIGVVALHLDSLPIDLIAEIDIFQAEAETFLRSSIFIPEYLIDSLRIKAVGWVEGDPQP